MAHQVVVKNIAKTEFFLGLASLIVDAIGIEGFQHVQEKVAEIWIYLETMKALLRAAEADAHEDAFGAFRPAWPPLDAARNLYMRWYPRIVEIIQQLSASGIIATVTEEDMKNPELIEDIRRYFQAARAEPTTASPSSAWPGTPPSPPSPAGRSSMNASSLGIRCASPASSSRSTTARPIWRRSGSS
jgi:aromatic ring hydroxylase